MRRPLGAATDGPDSSSMDQRAAEWYNQAEAQFVVRLLVQRGIVPMTQLLEKAIAEVSRLSEQEQDAIANWILDELKSERRWDKAFANSEDTLARLADEALVEHRKGHTQTLDPDRL